MQITLNFDETLLQEYEIRNSPLLFGIFFQQGSQFYPCENWTDFGVIILNWWIAALIHLLGRGRCQRFLFMDGPYDVEVRHRRSTSMMELRPRGLDVVWNIPPYELAEVILHAAETALQKLIQIEIAPREREALRQSINKLREVIQNRYYSLPLKN